MRINFAQFPIYDGIKKEKLIASNITEAFGDWIYKNVAGLKAHLLAEKIFKLLLKVSRLTKKRWIS